MTREGPVELRAAPSSMEIAALSYVTQHMYHLIRFVESPLLHVIAIPPGPTMMGVTASSEQDGYAIPLAISLLSTNIYT